MGRIKWWLALGVLVLGLWGGWCWAQGLGLEVPSSPYDKAGGGLESPQGQQPPPAQPQPQPWPQPGQQPPPPPSLPAQGGQPPAPDAIPPFPGQQPAQTPPPPQQPQPWQQPGQTPPPGQPQPWPQPGQQPPPPTVVQPPAPAKTAAPNLEGYWVRVPASIGKIVYQLVARAGDWPTPHTHELWLVRQPYPLPQLSKPALSAVFTFTGPVKAKGMVLAPDGDRHTWQAGEMVVHDLEHILVQAKYGGWPVQLQKLTENMNED